MTLNDFERAFPRIYCTILVEARGFSALSQLLVVPWVAFDELELVSYEAAAADATDGCHVCCRVGRWIITGEFIKPRCCSISCCDQTKKNLTAVMNTSALKAAVCCLSAAGRCCSRIFSRQIVTHCQINIDINQCRYTNYLRRWRKECFRVSLFVCLSVCPPDYSKSPERILMKF